MRLIDIGNLVGAHAEIADDHQQRADDERHGEHARLLHAAQLRNHDGEDRKHHAPSTGANGVADVVTRGFVGSELLFLVERTFRHHAQKAVAPIVDGFFHRILLARLVRPARGLAPSLPFGPCSAKPVGERYGGSLFVCLARGSAGTLRKRVVLGVVLVPTLHPVQLAFL